MSKISASQVLSTVYALRDSDRYIRTIFTQGGCYQFYLIVKSLRRDAVPLINKDKDHIVVMVDNVIFDIDGLKPAIGGFSVMNKKDHEESSKWSFSKSRMLSLGDCPHCDEPMVI